ncbi:PAP2 superfamily [Actinomyces bovis]|uniref:PAP2 superfamily n=1 Tax=Actinomyces bovis TaxID=1658 RepID=A0ABY1VQ61_9ACTO|nr:phosphatase PAP2 family protein [Actinomyces bovis]SPT54274.1 PAP2 superfamily [Actinomyces bovis]VEG56406.1 PAP2 superfamily [Actinomyces israelii]
MTPPTQVPAVQTSLRSQPGLVCAQADPLGIPRELPDPADTPAASNWHGESGMPEHAGATEPVAPSVLPALPAAAPVRRVWAGLLALTSWAGMLGIWGLLVLTRTGQQMEQAALTGSLIGARFVSGHARKLLQMITLPGLVVMILLVLALALWQGRRRRALWAAGVVIAINFSTQFLKHWVLWRPEYGLSQRWDGANTLPSGHTAVAASAAVALVLVVSARWRPAAAWAGALVAAAIGYSTLVCQWHRPADVIAALLLAFGWGALAVAGGCWNDDLPTSASRRPAQVLLVAGLLMGLVAAPLELWTWQGTAETASRVDTFVAYTAGSAATAALSCVSMALLVLLSRASAARLQSVDERGLEQL